MLRVLGERLFDFGLDALRSERGQLGEVVRPQLFDRVGGVLFLFDLLRELLQLLDIAESVLWYDLVLCGACAPPLGLRKRSWTWWARRRAGLGKG